MTRRPNEFLHDRQTIQFSNASTAADSTTKLWTVPAGRSFKIDRVWYNNPTGLVADPTNTVNIKITDGTNIAAKWDTTTGQEGALTANTPVTLTLSTNGAFLTLSAGEVLSLFIDISGTQTLPAGVGVVEGRLI